MPFVTSQSKANPIANYIDNFGFKIQFNRLSTKVCRFKKNKTGLQPVSRPAEQVPLLRGLGVGQSLIGSLAKQTQ